MFHLIRTTSPLQTTLQLLPHLTNYWKVPGTLLLNKTFYHTVHESSLIRDTWNPKRKIFLGESRWNDCFRARARSHLELSTCNRNFSTNDRVSRWNFVRRRFIANAVSAQTWLILYFFYLPRRVGMKRTNKKIVKNSKKQRFSSARAYVTSTLQCN